MRVHRQSRGTFLKVATITTHTHHPAEHVSSIRKDPKNSSLHIELQKKQIEIIARSKAAADEGAKIILWSEVLGNTIDDEPNTFVNSAKKLANDSQVYLFAALGINLSNRTLTDNKVVLYGPSGNEIFSYQKSNLSPGEPSIQGAKKFRFSDTEFGRLGAAICADFNFSYFMKAAGQNNLDIVFDPAAEWIEVARIQKAAAILRAVENGFNLVKATSSGYSLVATYTGAVLAESDEKTESPLIANVPFKGTKTIYSRGGWLFSLAVLVLFGGLILKNRNLWWMRIREL